MVHAKTNKLVLALGNILKAQVKVSYVGLNT